MRASLRSLIGLLQVLIAAQRCSRAAGRKLSSGTVLFASLTARDRLTLQARRQLCAGCIALRQKVFQKLKRLKVSRDGEACPRNCGHLFGRQFCSLSQRWLLQSVAAAAKLSFTAAGKKKLLLVSRLQCRLSTELWLTLCLRVLNCRCFTVSCGGNALRCCFAR